MRKTIISLSVLLSAATAQQTGTIEGIVTLHGVAMPEEVAVVAGSDVMPRARSTRSDAAGCYAFPQLIPGIYRLMFETANGASHTVTAAVLLDQTTIVRVELEPPAGSEIEELVVVGQRIGLRGRAALV